MSKMNKTFWVDQLKFKLREDIAFYEEQIQRLKSYKCDPVRDFDHGLVTAYEIAADRARRHLNGNIFDYIAEDLESAREYGVGT
jgi:hypothetical protein